jgi:lambda repressor-like predicted transcriptional regulator
MAVDQMHPEDIKAAIRKRFGTVGQFVEQKGLPKTGVSDLFRGRTSKRVREAVEAVIAAQEKSIELDDSGKPRTARRKTAGAA